MNPKITITIDAKNKAVASIEGMLTVGAKVDVKLTGLPSGIPDWASDDKFTGKSVRLRIVDFDGRDLARYPLVEKTNDSPDSWSESGDDLVNASGTALDLDTDGLRHAFVGVAFNETMEFGIIVDSIVDAAQYAVGKVKVRQWSASSTEDPTVLPDWRETLAKLKTDLASVEASKTDAETAAADAGISKTNAASSESNALAYANSALGYKNNASASAGNAATSESNAKVYSESAEGFKDAAEAAVVHYPKIDATNRHWLVWDASSTPPGWKDTGVVAEGADGDAATIQVGTVTTGAAGSSASVTNTGTTSAAVFNFTIPKGDKGDEGDAVVTDDTTAKRYKLGIDDGKLYLEEIS